MHIHKLIQRARETDRDVKRRRFEFTTRVPLQQNQTIVELMTLPKKNLLNCTFIRMRRQEYHYFFNINQIQLRKYWRVCLNH